MFGNVVKRSLSCLIYYIKIYLLADLLLTIHDKLCFIEFLGALQAYTFV